ncbi:hypothetical protein ABFS83_01G010900 [Erythranthe nasuta]
MVFSCMISPHMLESMCAHPLSVTPVSLSLSLSLSLESLSLMISLTHTILQVYSASMYIWGQKKLPLMIDLQCVFFVDFTSHLFSRFLQTHPSSHKILTADEEGYFAVLINYYRIPKYILRQTNRYSNIEI